MKKIFFTLLCAAVMVSCGGNKQKSHECDGNHAECTHQHTECDGNHTECTHQHAECDGNHEDCTGDCESNTGNCDSCTNNGETKQDKTTNCIQADNDIFLSKIADYKNPVWKYLGDKPAIVDFYADWCGPCKKIAPTLDEISNEYAGKLYIYKVNIDNCNEIAKAYQIEAIPTLLFIPVNGEPIKVVGGMEKSAIVENIAKIMK